MLIKSLLWVAGKIVEAVNADLLQRRDALLAELSVLHHAMDAGVISEEYLERQEEALLRSLDELDRLQPRSIL